MTAKIFTIAQQKGGAGKTTLVVHLGTYWASKKKKVCLIDIDPQGSLSFWYEMRLESVGESPSFQVRTVSGWRIESEIRRLADEFDVILIDSPPHAETESRIAVRAADLVLIPAQPSAVDVWATTPTLKLASDEGTDALVVLNRISQRSISLNEDVIARVKEMGADVAKSALRNYTAFSRSISEGKGVAEKHKTHNATKDIEALATEVWKRA